MRRVRPMVGQHSAAVIALHEHLMLLIAAHIGQQSAIGVRRGSTRHLGCGISRSRGGHICLHGRASNGSYCRGDRD